jgi:hypothetical protein
MLTIFCPPNETSTWETQTTVNGQATPARYTPRLYNGRFVLDCPPQFFVSVILHSRNGMLWERENPEAIAWLAKFQDQLNSDYGTAFPGADRPPPIVPVVTEVAPVIVKLRAPAGTTAYSYGGVENKIDKSGHVTVAENVADVLRSHGFLPA